MRSYNDCLLPQLLTVYWVTLHFYLVTTSFCTVLCIQVYFSSAV